MKVFEQQTAYLDIFLSVNVISNATTGSSYTMFDFSQIPIEGVTGKWYIKSTIEPKDLENTVYDVTNETKEIGAIETSIEPIKVEAAKGEAKIYGGKTVQIIKA